MEEYFISLDFLDDVLKLQPYEYSEEIEYKGYIYIITFRHDGIEVKKKGGDE